MDKYKGLRGLVEKIVAITGVNAIEFAKLKEAIIELAYEVDRIDKEDR